MTALKLPDNTGTRPPDQPHPQGHTVSRLVDPSLEMLAATLEDLEKTRIAAENRLRQFTRAEPDADGQHRGAALPEDHPAVRHLVDLVGSLQAVEHGAELALGRAMRRHLLYPWVRDTIGVGTKQGARLLAAVRDPYLDLRDGRPRTVSRLWAYAGLHVLPAGHDDSDAHEHSAGGKSGSTGTPAATAEPGTHTGAAADVSVRGDAAPGSGVAARRRRGQRANWSGAVKMRAYLIANSCIKQASSPYRKVYDNRRAHTEVTHPEWTAGHSHNDALRIVSKEILKDLWRMSRDIYAEVP